MKRKKKRKVNKEVKLIVIYSNHLAIVLLINGCTTKTLGQVFEKGKNKKGNNNRGAAFTYIISETPLTNKIGVIYLL